MEVLDKVKMMKEDGFDDSQISQRLKKDGVSPKEVDEALDQSNVKSAVGTYEDFSPSYPQDVSQDSGSMYPDFQPQSGRQNSEDKIEIEPPIQYSSAPTQNVSYQNNSYAQQTEQYPQYQYAQPVDTEVISEIVEQIIEEKVREIKKNVDELMKFKVVLQGRTDNLNERLRMIEGSIDKLQSAVIGQVGNFGRNISDLKKEVHVTQESFSKILNPLSDNLEELRKITEGFGGKSDSKEKKKSDSTK